MRPILRQTSPPAAEPLSLDDAKRFLRVTVDADDAIIDDAIASARQQFELATSRQVIEATWEALFPWFPGWLTAPRGTRLKLPFPPLVRVESVRYRDAGGSYQTWPAEKYTTIAPSELRAGRGWIEPAVNETWPSTCGGVSDAVRVSFVCGYADPDAVPAMIVSTIKALIGSEYEHRKAEGTGPAAIPNPAIARALRDLEVKLGS